MATSCGFESHRPHHASPRGATRGSARPVIRAARVRRRLSAVERRRTARGGGALLQQIGLFEMRRLEMLSNTIFGVAMTLLAYDLPKASSFKQAPSWIDVVNVYAQPVIALTISFIVAGLFWFSHHRRLAVAPEAGRGVV